jgi:hypothetical protein
VTLVIRWAAIGLALPFAGCATTGSGESSSSGFDLSKVTCGELFHGKGSGRKLQEVEEKVPDEINESNHTPKETSEGVGATLAVTCGASKNQSYKPINQGFRENVVKFMNLGQQPTAPSEGGSSSPETPSPSGEEP